MASKVGKVADQVVDAVSEVLEETTKKVAKELPEANRNTIKAFIRKRPDKQLMRDAIRTGDTSKLSSESLNVYNDFISKYNVEPYRQRSPKGKPSVSNNPPPVDTPPVNNGSSGDNLFDIARNAKNGTAPQTPPPGPNGTKFKATNDNLMKYFGNKGMKRSDARTVIDSMLTGTPDNLDDSLRPFYNDAMNDFEGVDTWRKRVNGQKNKKNVGNDAEASSISGTPIGLTEMKDPITKKDSNNPSKFQNFVQSDWPKVIVGGGVAAYTASQLTKRNGNKGRMSNAELYNQK